MKRYLILMAACLLVLYSFLVALDSRRKGIAPEDLGISEVSGAAPKTEIKPQKIEMKTRKNRGVNG